jgi:Zn-dependent M16 (insulinase) family peptidase
MNTKLASRLFAVSAAITMILSPLRAARGQEPAVSFDKLTQGQLVSNFRVAALYAGDDDRAIGGRFLHAPTGFTLDVVQIQSVPQGHLWVNSFPTSDMGEPHTQEHLLLGKGNKGRAVASYETMSLTGSNAYTMQWRTVYNFHTAAGPEVFYDYVERQLDALLHPDYTDEEIRREVRNFGVIEDPADKSLRLEEKGSVYNEMVATYSNGDTRLFDAVGRSIWGAAHPFALSAGGTPAAIREMLPEHIKRFHRENYHLAQMGLIVSVPKEMPPAQVLARFDRLLTRLQAGEPRRKVRDLADVPAPRPAPAGRVEIVEYPHQNDQQPGSLVFAWPAALRPDPQERVLLELFLSNLAGDATTNLYKKFVDTKTRELDLGAKGVWYWIDPSPGNPVYVGLSDVAVANMTEAKIAEARGKVLDELRRVAAFKDNSPELAEFNGRLKSRVIETRRALSKIVNTPPGFGFRNTGALWMEHLESLNRAGGFRKSLTLKPEMAGVEKLLASGENAWAKLLPKWGLTQTVPYAAAAKANPKLVEQEERERKGRADAELARLKALYKVEDAQEAVRRYRTDYDAATAALERLERQDSSARFIERPPLTLDDQLDFKVSAVEPGRVPLVASTFENMTSATTGLALRLDAVPDEELVYLSMLPRLFTQVGVIRDGRPVSNEEMSELLRREILSLSAYYSTNLRTGRAELVVKGAGNNADESARAVEWMRLVLNSPDWRAENLPRIRDLVDQTLSELRNTTNGAEENWAQNPASAYRKQDDPLYLSVASFLTRAHNVQRLRWMLKDAGSPADREAVASFLDRLSEAGAKAKADELKLLLRAMQGDAAARAKIPAALLPHAEEFTRLGAPAGAVAVEAAKDLEQMLAEVPEETLAADWRYLCRQMRHDLSVTPAAALASLNRVRAGLLKTGGARLFLVGSRATQGRLDAPVRSLVSDLKNEPAAKAARAPSRLVEARLSGREAGAPRPVFVGLVTPSMKGGVFLNSAPAATYADTDRESLLRHLAAKLYGGGGAHSIFMKTWGAGLAYGNGVGGSPSSGRITYYADRVPELPQTLRFVIGELKRAEAEPDPSLVEYAVAGAFAEFRSASEYETRAEAMAADLADGLTPERVRAFRTAVLGLRSAPNLAGELFKRMGAVYAAVLPGYGPAKARDVEGAIYMVIGPEKQIDVYEKYLKSVEGADARVFRLYPRDFWMTAKV